MMEVQGKTALITGATSGIGAAYAEKFAAMGCNLILTGRRMDKLNAFAEELRRRYHVNVETFQIELGKGEGVETLLNAVTARPIDILINNAGFGYSVPFSQGDIRQWEDMVNVHILSSMKLTRGLLPGMLARNSGIVINVSSDSAFLLIANNAVYAATKTFLKTFTESLRIELAGTGVQVQAVCPGLTRSDFHPKMGMDPAKLKDHGPVKWMEPEDVVTRSLRDLAKGKTVSVPSPHDRQMIWLLGILPRETYYRVMTSASKNLFGKK